MRRLRTVAVLAAIAMLTTALVATTASAAETRTYTVTITNLTDGQPFTPALATSHKGNTGLFRVGSAASFELKEIAENGNLGPMVERIGNSTDFHDLVVETGNTGVPPVMPGETISFQIEAAPPYNFLSWASMLICSNDGFTGVDGVKLPNHLGQSVSVFTQGYDAGTEMNTEAWSDLVPPCGPLTGQDSMGQGTGSSDPALAEGGVIHHHGGILGIADLDAAINDWDNPVGMLTVERTG